LVLIFVFYCILCVFLPHLYLTKKHAFSVQKFEANWTLLNKIKQSQVLIFKCKGLWTMWKWVCSKKNGYKIL